MINDENLSDDLSAFVEDLRQQSLQAHHPDRDRLMFECGRAAATAPAILSRGSNSVAWLKQGLIVACSMCLGALLMHQQTRPAGSPIAEPVRSDFENATESNALAAQLAELYSSEQLAAVRSNQMLCASSDPEVVTDVWVNPAIAPLDPAPALRARMINRFGLMP